MIITSSEIFFLPSTVCKITFLFLLNSAYIAFTSSIIKIISLRFVLEYMESVTFLSSSRIRLNSETTYFFSHDFTLCFRIPFNYTVTMLDALTILSHYCLLEVNSQTVLKALSDAISLRTFKGLFQMYSDFPNSTVCWNHCRKVQYIFSLIISTSSPVFLFIPAEL
jgi:hypothetical protein